jgi:hypothetical protein
MTEQGYMKNVAMDLNWGMWSMYGNGELHRTNRGVLGGKLHEMHEEGSCIGWKSCTGWKNYTGWETSTGGELQQREAAYTGGRAT